MPQPVRPTARLALHPKSQQPKTRVELSESLEGALKRILKGTLCKSYSPSASLMKRAAQPRGRPEGSTKKPIPY